MRSVILRFAALTLVVGLLAGCGETSDRALRMTLAALGTHIPQPSQAPSTPAPNSTCGDVKASLRPPPTLPTPGAMPAASFMAKIARRGYLVAGVDQNTLLFAYFNPLDQRLEGFEIDLLRQLANAIFGNPNAIQFRAVTTAERIPAVQGGSVDIVADAVTINCERRKQVDFSTAYYDAGQRVLVSSNSHARGINDFRGKRVCATTGSTSIDNLKRLMPTAVRYPVAQRTDCLVALQEGLVDAVTSDDAILLGFKAQDPNTKIVGPRFTDEPYGMAISKANQDFVRFVNGVLDQMRANGTLRQIYARWLSGLGATPAPPPADYLG
jgi:polar amino acid transport system substrate-binding protein